MPRISSASPPKPPAARAPEASGYRKGEEARQRILESALQAFGANGFKGATTRLIAEAAGVNLPALTYYFGGKEGLYLACAEEIVGRYRTRMLGVIAGAEPALRPNGRPAQARAALKAIVGALAELLVGSREAEVWTSFVQREMAEQGPAFAILYEQVWSPGVALVAHMIGRPRQAGGVASRHDRGAAADLEPVRVQRRAPGRAQVPRLGGCRARAVRPVMANLDRRIDELG